MANRCRQCSHVSEQAGNCPVCNIPMIDEVKMQMPGGDQPAVTPVPGQPKPGEGVTPQMPQTDTSGGEQGGAAPVATPPMPAEAPTPADGGADDVTPAV